MEDPIAVPITNLEQDKDGNPKEFVQLVKEMVDGKQGDMKIMNANRLLPKVKTNKFSWKFAFFDCYFLLLFLRKCSTSHLLLFKFNRL